VLCSHKDFHQIGATMLAVKSPANMHLDHQTASSSSSSSFSSSSSIANQLEEDGDRTLDLGDSSESSSDEEEGGIFFGTHTINSTS
jgi:hypothetical protein